MEVHALRANYTHRLYEPNPFFRHFHILSHSSIPCEALYQQRYGFHYRYTYDLEQNIR